MAAKLDVNSSRYKDALEHTSTYNSRLVFERKQRSPFLDSQTGVAQVSCHLWKSKLVRRAPAYPYQLYSYPARRWKNRPKKVPTPAPSEPIEAEPATEEQIAEPSEIAANPVPITTELNTSFEEKEEPIEVPEAEESEEESENDSEEEEETSSGSNRRPGRPGRPPKRIQPSTNMVVGSGKQQVRNYTKEELAKMSYEERQKPYACELCGKRYKNGPGLKYHYTHYNHDQDESSYSGETPESTSVAPSLTTTTMPTTSSVEPSVQLPATKPQMSEPKRTQEAPSITPNDYCDFCLGDVKENKKTLLSEELLSCADCGRSGHPTCLQFTVKLTYNVKKYRWQCIECKSCTLCGTSDNDDQLLFCDDCDRGYHMYCLKPAMETPPEGSWICKLCEDEDLNDMK